MDDYNRDVSADEEKAELGSSLADPHGGLTEAPDTSPESAPVEEAPAEEPARGGFTYTNSRGSTYYLHSRETTLKNGLQRTLYFFAKDPRPGVMNAVPAGYQVAETKNGLPVLKKA